MTTTDKYQVLQILMFIYLKREDFTINGTTVTPVKADHGFLLVHGFRIGNLAYMTDVKTIEPQEEKFKGLDVLIIMPAQRNHNTFKCEEAFQIL
jgi:phosphoribosyl 1,2-cyclic phosphate phosphodiesterase